MSFRARQAALKALTASPLPRDAHIRKVLAPLPVSDRRHANDLVLGVERRTQTWDSILDAFLDHGVQRLPLGLRAALRMGVYELLSNDRVPVPIVINETVELFRTQRKVKGLVNAVLRRIRDAMESCDLAHCGGEPDVYRIQLSDGRAVRFDRAVLPDPAVSLQEWAAAQFSVTPWFAERMITLLPLEWEALLRSTIARLPVALRPRVGVTKEDLARMVSEAGGRVLRNLETILEVQIPGDIGVMPAVQSGLARVQDLVTSEVVPFAEVLAGQSVLDACASPGGKTVHILETTQGNVRLLPCVRGADELSLVQSSLKASGFEKVRIHDLGPKGDRWPKGTFDRVLLDVPCSNSGVFMKRTQARYRCVPRDIESLARVQDKILSRAAASVAEGGRLIYSTCSILPEENQDRIAAFLLAHPEFRLEEEHLRYPHRTTRDGGYMARLART